MKNRINFVNWYCQYFQLLLQILKFITLNKPMTIAFFVAFRMGSKGIKNMSAFFGKLLWEWLLHIARGISLTVWLATCATVNRINWLSFTKIHLQLPSPKCWSFWLRLKVLTYHGFSNLSFWCASMHCLRVCNCNVQIPNMYIHTHTYLNTCYEFTIVQDLGRYLNSLGPFTNEG